MTVHSVKNMFHSKFPDSFWVSVVSPRQNNKGWLSRLHSAILRHLFEPQELHQKGLHNMIFNRT